MKKERDSDKYQKRADKATEIIASIGMATSISSLLTLIPFPTDNELSIITGGTILFSPCIYFGMNYLKDKMKERNIRDQHHTAQTYLMMTEANSVDH